MADRKIPQDGSRGKYELMISWISCRFPISALITSAPITWRPVTRSMPYWAS